MIKALAIPEMAKAQIQKDYYFKQVYKIRESALFVAVFSIGVFLYLDYVRFEGFVYQQILSTRIVYQVIPTITILVFSLILQANNFSRSRLNYFASTCVILIGVGHAEIYQIAHANGLYFPKFGLAIILFYAGILLVLPLNQSILSCAIIIAYATYVYVGTDDTFSEVITVTVFYSVFAICCIWMNWICTKVLKVNYDLVKRINQLANTDNLTELSNRRSFFEHADYVHKMAFREQKSFAIILVDLDHFKLINDKLGHKAGDLVLLEVCQILSKKCRRPLDLAARFGGDEFVMILYDSNLEHINVVCQKIIDEIKEIAQKLTDIHNIHGFGASVGVVQNTINEEFNIESLIELADHELYKVKSKSKNSFSIADKNMYYHNNTEDNSLSNIRPIG